MIFRWLRASCLLAGCALAAYGADVPRAGRLTGTFAGIECEYSPGQEELGRLLAQRIAQHNREAAVGLAQRKSDFVRAIPLSPGEMRENRAVYLGRIAASLGLERVTPLQEECYDAFLDNYEQTMASLSQIRSRIQSLQVIKRFALWERSELVRRLEGGEKIPGFSYDPATKTGSVTYGFHGTSHDDKLQELAAKREKLRMAYSLNLQSKDGLATYRGQVSPKKKDRPASPAQTSAPEDHFDGTEWLPVIIPSEIATLPVAEAAEKLWDGPGDHSLTKLFAAVGDGNKAFPDMDPTIAFVVLHETTEIGIIDHYFLGPDRRWFCDGMANYVPWRVARDLQGADIAARVYNLPEQLARYAGWREKADLRKWPATENQSEEEQHSELNSARYAFAARAVFLMNERAGDDVLPRLFTEIGKAKPDKVSIKTVEKAWQKVTGTKLDSILADAVKP